MKAILKFDLPDEKDEFTLAVNGNDYYLFMLDFKRKIREWFKYSDKETISLEELEDTFTEISANHNVDVDDVE